MKVWRAFILLFTLSLAACSSTSPVSETDERLSLVYGYFDMKDAPTKAQWVGLKQYSGGDGGTYTINVQDGLFFHVGIEPGSYQVDKFGGSGFLRGDYVYNFGGKGRNATAVRLQKPGVYFLGSYRYVNHSGKGFFDPAQFDMQPVKTPSEKEILQRVVKQLETDREFAGYKRQLRQAKERLSKL